MGDYEMRAGIRHFLHMGGAESMAVDELVPIKLKCEQVLSDKNVPSAKTVHFLLEGKKKAVACNLVYYVRNITEDNSSYNLIHVTCGGCKKSKAFRKANGEDGIRDQIRHLTIRVKTEHGVGNVSGYGSGYGYIHNSWVTQHSLAICTRTEVLGSAVAKNPTTVTCKNCLKAEEYQDRLKAYNKRKKKEEVSV